MFAITYNRCRNAINGHYYHISRITSDSNKDVIIKLEKLDSVRGSIHQEHYCSVTCIGQRAFELIMDEGNKIQ